MGRCYNQLSDPARVQYRAFKVSCAAPWGHVVSKLLHVHRKQWHAFLSASRRVPVSHAFAAVSSSPLHPCPLRPSQPSSPGPDRHRISLPGPPALLSRLDYLSSVITAKLAFLILRRLCPLSVLECLFPGSLPCSHLGWTPHQPLGVHDPAHLQHPRYTAP